MSHHDFHKRTVDYLKAAGYEIVSWKGGHVKMRLNNKTVIVPRGLQDRNLGNKIFKQAGLEGVRL